MSEREITYGVLNVTAHPHPNGVYVRLLRKVARQPVQFWGDDYAAITEPEQQENGLFLGRIIVWTEVDPNSPAIDKATLQEVELEKAVSELADKYGVNGRVFLYVLRTRDHKILFEMSNEFGKRLSPGRAVKIFSNLLAEPQLSPLKDPRVEVSIQPEDDALDRVLGIHKLTRLEINIPKPNGDDMFEETEKILKEIEEQNARSLKKELVSEHGKSLKPNKRTLAEASLAVQLSGSVRGIGEDEDGNRDERSTETHPKIIRRSFPKESSRSAAIITVARSEILS